MMSGVRDAVVLMCIGLCLPGVGLARDYSKPGQERFKFGAGVYFQRYDTTVRVKGENVSEYLNLEDDLGYDDDSTGSWIGGYWRFAERHRLALSYYESKRDVTAVATTDIDIGDDEVIPAGAGYTSDFNIKILPVQYLYSFMKRDKFELSGTLGLHWYDIDYDIEGVAGVGDINVNESVEAEANAPMPLGGVAFDYYLTSRWHINLLGEVFYLAYSGEELDFEGSLLNLRAGTEYWLWKNVGVGAAMNYFALDVSIDDSSWNGDLEYDYWGPQAYLTVRY